MRLIPMLLSVVALGWAVGAASAEKSEPNLLGWEAGSVSASAEKSESKLFGMWNCSTVVEQDGVRLSMDLNTNYVRNGRSNTVGRLKLEFSTLPLEDMEYSLVGTGTWEMIDGYLVEVSEDVRTQNISHPDMGDVLNIGDMFPSNASESYQVVTLTAKCLTLKGEADGTIFQCRRPKTNRCPGNQG